MPLGGEQRSVQHPFICYAIDAGWTNVTPERSSS
jgi:hypothetical protein